MVLESFLDIPLERDFVVATRRLVGVNPPKMALKTFTKLTVFEVHRFLGMTLGITWNDLDMAPHRIPVGNEGLVRDPRATPRP